MVELQRLEVKPDRTEEGLRLARELWEILRRKQGCVLHHFYSSPGKRTTWLVYSEWQSLNELGGARRELARSPLYRRLHSTLAASSERAYEPFGAIRSLRGTNFAAQPSVLLIEFASSPEDSEAALDFLKEFPGYLSHLPIHEVSEAKTLLCLAHFDNERNAAAAKERIEKQDSVRALLAGIEAFTA